jgi:hypothetical protein
VKNAEVVLSHGMVAKNKSIAREPVGARLYIATSKAGRLLSYPNDLKNFFVGNAEKKLITKEQEQFLFSAQTNASRNFTTLGIVEPCHRWRLSK